MKKYIVPIYIETVASYCIGEVEVSSADELAEKAKELWAEQEYDVPSNYACNDFDLDEWGIEQINRITDADLKHYEVKS